ncbi:MAG: cold shock and DUF1294 domain-containing protein [Rubrivivax sp.]|nr:cold shock and DUF1294 domain-containing protein [Rubrivivax sp.]
MRFDGTIRSWNDERGFGFIAPAQGGDEIFVHVKAFRVRNGRPQAGQRVSFEVEPGPQGRKRAKDVEAVREQRPSRRPPGRRAESPAAWGTATLFAIPAFLLVCVVVGVVWRPPLAFAAVYLAASALAFGAYALDKWAAARGAWRTSEGTLHAIALAGGWPGALLAQQLLRHKSSKAAFRSTFWGTVVLNVAAFVLLSVLASGRG